MAPRTLSATSGGEAYHRVPPAGFKYLLTEDGLLVTAKIYGQVDADKDEIQITKPRQPVSI
jgi:hypothetical protein